MYSSMRDGDEVGTLLFGKLMIKFTYTNAVTTNTLFLYRLLSSTTVKVTLSARFSVAFRLLCFEVIILYDYTTIREEN
jgi:hypothetical protein